MVDWSIVRGLLDLLSSDDVLVGLAGQAGWVDSDVLFYYLFFDGDGNYFDAHLALDRLAQMAQFSINEKLRKISIIQWTRQSKQS